MHINWSKHSTSVWSQHGAGVAGSGRDFDPLCAVLDIIGRTWHRDKMIHKWMLWRNIRKEKGTLSLWPLCVCVCVRVRLTEPCAGGQWVCTVWSSAAAGRWGFRVVTRALLLAQVQAQTTLVLWAAQTKNKALGNTHLIMRTMLTQLFEHAQYFTVQS